jgi:hypothetical protein
MIVQRSNWIIRNKEFGLTYTLSQIVEFIARSFSKYSSHLSVLYMNGVIY